MKTRIIFKEGMYFPQYKNTFSRKWFHYQNNGIEVGYYDAYKAHLYLQRKGLAEDYLFCD